MNISWRVGVRLVERDTTGLTGWFNYRRQGVGRGGGGDWVEVLHPVGI